jgi:teichuronic acid biosynthesis glycosyltransferase TuaC
MKVLVLAKRQYMGKDLLEDRFGRFWELPLELARRGHDVRGIALSYRTRSEGKFASADAKPGALEWYAVNLLKAPWPNERRYFSVAARIIQAFQPNLIWACSDAYHAIFGHRLAKHSGIKLVVDLYDNFESYPATNVPGVRFLFERALRAAHGITFVSSQLENYVRGRYRVSAPALILENAIRADLFQPMKRQECRRRLQLPQDAKIIGTAGALFPSRGIATLYRAFDVLTTENPDIHLALAGPRPARSGIPAGESVHDLGVLSADLVPFFLNSLDVAVVCNRDSAFGRYGFPQKAREIIACGIAMVGAEVGAMKDILQDRPECLFKPDDITSLVAAIRGQLAAPTVIPEQVPAWSHSAASLETFFDRVQRSQT